MDISGPPSSCSTNSSSSNFSKLSTTRHHLSTRPDDLDDDFALVDMLLATTRRSTSSQDGSDDGEPGLKEHINYIQSTTGRLQDAQWACCKCGRWKGNVNEMMMYTCAGCPHERCLCCRPQDLTLTSRVVVPKMSRAEKKRYNSAFLEKNYKKQLKKNERITGEHTLLSPGTSAASSDGESCSSDDNVDPVVRFNLAFRADHA